MENIARDMAEGRFPERSPPKMVPIDDVWSRVLDDPELAAARGKLSIHELRTIVGHVQATALPRMEPSEAFAEWINQGPKLASAAGCHVGIKVTEAK